MPAERILVRGIVQGVGFRPFVWRLAHQLGLCGEVGNAGDAVRIDVEGGTEDLDAFVQALTTQAPALAHIADISRAPAALRGWTGFTIAASGPGTVSVGIVPDLATCPACLAELRDPTARRSTYAFTTCSGCGPRFSIVEELPYDRATTTMRGFRLCAACRMEYEDPADRRFHAQPIACPACGPHLWFESADGVILADDPIARATALLRAGGIVGVKGIGGFHIACDATDEAVIVRLRARKQRPTKPLAVMLRDRAMVERFCRADPAQIAALEQVSAPIVLLRPHPAAPFAPALAPGQDRIGVILPYAPVHHRLMAAIDRPLVMTSANRSGAPQVYGDEEARSALAGLVDGLLLHDRPIARRLDDSLAQIGAGRLRILRRGRGLAPAPRDLPADFAGAPQVLALGGVLKNAICLTAGRAALLSHHLGDLDTLATYDAFERAISDYTAIFDHHPAAIAIDLHPDLPSSRLGLALAKARGLPLLGVQHHHAHIAATMAEQGWPRAAGPVIGLALDGFGLGEDGTIWGAEILLSSYETSRRLACLRPIRLAGGDAASREPWRALFCHLHGAIDPGAWPQSLFETLPVATLEAMIRRGVNAPLASSAGRLFDAMAALLALTPQRQSFEGEAAMALQALAQTVPPHLAYPFDSREAADGLIEIDPTPMWRAALADLRRQQAHALIARRFHDGVARAFADNAARLARAHGIGTVALSGGVFQNVVLLEAVQARLTALGLESLIPEQVPVNDGGLAFGQAAVAAARLLAG